MFQTSLRLGRFLLGTGLLGLLSLPLRAQDAVPLSLDSCQRQAWAHYPLSRQLGLLQQSEAYTLSNAAKGYLPQLSVQGQASYQSAVTAVPVPLPGVTPLDKDQYRLQAEVSQLLWDGGAIGGQRDAARASAAVDRQRLEVERHKVRERVQQLFFGVLLLESQLQQAALKEQDILLAQKRTQALVGQGMALRSQADVLEVALLRTRQQQQALERSKEAYKGMLNQFLGRAPEASLPLAEPADLQPAQEVVRPELQLFSLQQQQLGTQQRLLRARHMPKLGLFFQGGYGRPGLNMLKNEFDFFYVTGLRLQWQLGSLYTYRKEKGLLSLGQQQLGLQQEAFLFNTRQALYQQRQEVDRLQQMQQSDAEIVRLQERVRQAALVQLEQGTLSATDYLREVNTLEEARQQQGLHRLQALQARYQQQLLTGNE